MVEAVVGILSIRLTDIKESLFGIGAEHEEATPDTSLMTEIVRLAKVIKYVVSVYPEAKGDLTLLLKDIQ